MYHFRKAEKAEKPYIRIDMCTYVYSCIHLCSTPSLTFLDVRGGLPLHMYTRDVCSCIHLCSPPSLTFLDVRRGLPLHMYTRGVGASSSMWYSPSHFP